MPRGRKPMPTQLKVVNGNPGKRKLPDYRASRASRLRPPVKLTSDQQKIWAHSVKYAPYGLLKNIDTALLYQYVVTRASFEEASLNYESGPKLIKTPNGLPVISPWFYARNKQSQLMLSLASELGFTPSGRARLGASESHEPPSENSWFDQHWD